MALTSGQQRCVDTLDRSIVVAAGAGSGKTFTLTERIVRAIESGQVSGIDRVCAITFTNKAATELKSRIKAKLRAYGLAEQALSVDEAWVSTIHGMCARILRAHALELDIDPAFSMADSVQAGRLLTETLDTVLARAQAGDVGGISSDALDALFEEYPARSAGPRGVSVESMLVLLMGKAGASPLGFDVFEAPAPSANPVSLVHAVTDAFEALVDAANAQKPSASREEWVGAVETAIGGIRADMQSDTQLTALDALRMLDSLPAPKKVGTADYKQHVSEVLDLYRMSVMELRLAAAYPHLETLLALAGEAQNLFVSAKRQAGILDNNDLLVMASKAITSHPEIAALYADKFQLVMVDEFQDTDQLQVDMIKLLAGPRAQRLCTVGDAQQSIYRFRGADVSVYRRHLESVRAGNPDDVILLPDNFRSHADVLSLVDRVFERDDMFGGEFMSLAPGRDNSRVKRPFADDVARVRVQLTSNAYRGASSLQVRQIAAARIADEFAELRELGHGAGEMAVLLGGMTYAGVYAEALRSRGFACVISGGSVFAGTLEAKVVCELARVAANPSQTQSLFNVLAGPLFHLSADDLLHFSTKQDMRAGVPSRRDLASGLLSYARAVRVGDSLSSDSDSGAAEQAGTALNGDADALQAAEPAAPGDSHLQGFEASPQLQLAVRVMGEFLFDVGTLPVSQLIMRAVVNSGWLTRLQQQGAEGLAQAANVYKAIRMVESVETSGAAGPAQVARTFQELLSSAKEAPGALSASGGDFVRIMTVHASKGLEFPIVAVAEFSDAGGSSSRLLASDVEGKTYLSLDLGNTISSLQGPAKLRDVPALYASMVGDLADEDELAQAIGRADGALMLRAALFERDRIGDAEESKRLLYVALTRAKEALVISLRGKRTKDNPNAMPKNCLAAVPLALAGESGFDLGSAAYGYGGTMPAQVEHVAAEQLLEEAAQEEEGDNSQQDTEGEQELFVPAEEKPAAVDHRPVARLSTGVFSYSSIAEASHEGDVLARLAERFTVSVDEPADDSAQTGEADAGFPWSAPSAFDPISPAGLSTEDDDFWDDMQALPADDDKATDLGTAFHRLAQYAVETRDPANELEMPPASRVAALSRTCNLGELQRARLAEALKRWFESDIAGDMAAYCNLRAEVPFFLRVPCDSASVAVGDAELDPAGSRAATQNDESAKPLFLEGEIDLLAIDDSGKRAHVVDYKTGGSDAEDVDALSRKHVLQAACYAYAIMQQGIAEVVADFVRVEHVCRGSDNQPQCVRYRFESADVPMLAEVIAQVYAKSTS